VAEEVLADLQIVKIKVKKIIHKVAEGVVRRADQVITTVNLMIMTIMILMVEVQKYMQKTGK